MLINLSNHPSGKWDEKQINKAKELYGSVLDMKFPAIDPAGDQEYIENLANIFFKQVVDVFDECANEPFPNAVHIQGEFTFVCKLVSLLKSSNIKCVASTTVRNVEELKNGEKNVKFMFVRFREY